MLHSVKDMGHTWVADVQPGKRTPKTDDCQAPFKDGIANCGIDMAGEMLEHLLLNIPDGPTEIQPKSDDWRSLGVLKKFD